MGARRGVGVGLLAAVVVTMAGCSGPARMAGVSAGLSRDERAALERAGWSRQVGSGLGLWVSVARQRLVGIQGGEVRFEYRCSSAARGVGQREGSNQTPLGWHEVAEKIGAGLPSGAVLCDRVFTGEVWSAGQPTERDLILTRILWLRGREPGVNAGPGVDSYGRYIYIHGTPAEAKLGRPASAGCIRLSNRDVMELFDRVSEGTAVLITEW